LSVSVCPGQEDRDSPRLQPETGTLGQKGRRLYFSRLEIPSEVRELKDLRGVRRATAQKLLMRELDRGAPTDQIIRNEESRDRLRPFANSLRESQLETVGTSTLTPLPLRRNLIPRNVPLDRLYNFRILRYTRAAIASKQPMYRYRYDAAARALNRNQNQR
jgi:hypothetical protein